MIIIRIRLFILSIIAVFSVTAFFSTNLFAITKLARKIVVFKEYVTPSRKHELLKKHCIEKVKDISGINGIVVNLSKGTKLKDEIDVAYIEDDFVLSIHKNNKIDQLPISPEKPVTQEIIPWGIDYMGAQTYWDTVKTDTINVGILDTGIELNHPDIKENIKGRYNALTENKSANDDNGHGTHIAGILAASRNSLGVVGMVPDVNLYSIKVLDSNGNGYVSDIINGINWAISNKVDIFVIGQAICQ